MGRERIRIPIHEVGQDAREGCNYRACRFHKCHGDTARRCIEDLRIGTKAPCQQETCKTIVLAVEYLRTFMK